MFKKILMICIGNICRSPVAEYLLIDHFNKTGREDYHVSSAGIHAMVDSPAHACSQKVIQEQSGIDISQHIARQITPEILQEHDLILVMESSHQKYLQRNHPSTHGKVQLLGKWNSLEIDDPYGMPYLEFEKMHANICHSLNEWIQRYWP